MAELLANTRIIPTNATPIEFFSGAQQKAKVEKFIRFCRGGEFLIG